MKIKEIKELTGLTRKAIDYYEEKGFISPERDENNYRDYSEEDLEILKKVALYRKAGCSIKEIKGILYSEEKSSLASLIRKREIRSELEKERIDSLKLLLKGADKEEIEEKLSSIDKKETIYEKLSTAFPGYFGQTFLLSYKPFFDQPLDLEKISSYEKYIDFLDKIPDLELSLEEKNLIENISNDISLDQIDKTNMDKMEAVENPKKFLKENEDLLKSYMLTRNYPDNKDKPLIKILGKIRDHMEKTGYYKIAIPLIREFSPAYDQYYKKLLKANEEFLGVYGEG